MELFWLIVVLLILIGLVFVLMPLLVPTANKEMSTREDINKAIYLGKVEDLQADLDKSLLDQEEYEHALVDLQQTLLQDAGQQNNQEEVKQASSGGNIAIILSVALILPVSAVLIYQQISTGGYTNEIVQHQAQATSSQVQSMENAIATLEAKLKDKPDNVEGWKMLGQSYFVIQRYDDAKQSYIKALDLVNQADPELLVLTAEASAFSNNELFSAYEKSLLEKALTINPKHQRGLWYSGYAAYTTSKFTDAVDYWETLLTLVPKERPEVKESLLKFLNDAREKSGMPTVDEAMASMSQEESTQRTIKVSVQLNEKVNQQAQSGDTLFIYARAVDGPKMPLSLERLTVAKLPVTVILSKEKAMLPNMDIDTFDKVEVLARISKSGQAITQKGDLISNGVVVDFSQSSSAAVSLDINSVVE